MKKMKILCIFFLLYSGTSCKDHKDTLKECLLVDIYNKTNDSIHVKLYPNANYSTPNGKFFFVYDGSSGLSESEYDLPAHKPWCDSACFSNFVFWSQDLNIKPYTQIAKMFDSIYIHTKEKILKFTPDTVYGYSENIFNSNSTWDFSIFYNEYPDNRRSNLTKHHCYRFSILENKITN